jgi:hypothetical protein
VAERDFSERDLIVIYLDGGNRQQIDSHVVTRRRAARR